MPNISELAAEAATHFERITRGDATITVLRDDTPEWVRDLVHYAHGEFMPDDWRYAAIEAALDAIVYTGAEDAAELDDAGYEWADGHVDVYTGARLTWLASNLQRVGYVDEAVEELGRDVADTGERIGLGQFAEAREVWGLVVEALAERVEELS